MSFQRIWHLLWHFIRKWNQQNIMMEMNFYREIYIWWSISMQRYQGKKECDKFRNRDYFNFGLILKLTWWVIATRKRKKNLKVTWLVRVRKRNLNSRPRNFSTFICKVNLTKVNAKLWRKKNKKRKLHPSINFDQNYTINIITILID